MTEGISQIEEGQETSMTPKDRIIEELTQQFVVTEGDNKGALTQEGAESQAFGVDNPLQNEYGRTPNVGTLEALKQSREYNPNNLPESKATLDAADFQGEYHGLSGDIAGKAYEQIIGMGATESFAKEKAEEIAAEVIRNQRELVEQRKAEAVENKAESAFESVPAETVPVESNEDAALAEARANLEKNFG